MAMARVAVVLLTMCLFDTLTKHVLIASKPSISCCISVVPMSDSEPDSESDSSSSSQGDSFTRNNLGCLS
jgi:hypothetical protein